MANRPAWSRAVRGAALAAALLGGFAAAQEAGEAAAGAAPGRQAPEEPAPVVAPEALLELPYVYPLMPMRPPPAPR